MNVTPLVDVVLVLLIIFMVVIPQLEAGASVTPPPAENIDAKSDVDYEPLTVSITGQGDIYYDRKQLSRDALVAELSRAHAAAPQRKLQIKGDREVDYAVVRDVFRDCQKLGFPGVGLAVGEKKKD